MTGLLQFRNVHGRGGEHRSINPGLLDGLCH